MTTQVLAPLPPPLVADRPPEARGIERDGVRLLVSSPGADRGYQFRDLPSVLEPGDLLVVNESATLPASLPAVGGPGAFLVNLSTEYGPGLWLVEPRWNRATPGPLPLRDGAEIRVAGLAARVLARYPGIARLCFVRFEGDVREAMAREGRPIGYGYLAGEFPIDAYQTVFARVPGSAEMPSAARPFTERTKEDLKRRGVAVAPIVLHTGVSSLEEGDSVTGEPPVFPEPYDVPRATADRIAATRATGGRVVAVGTTVARALESAAELGAVRPSRGFTRRYLSSANPPRAFDALLTGFHTSASTHRALLEGVAGESVVSRSYRRAAAEGYLWHEFGDVQLLFRR